MNDREFWNHMKRGQRDVYLGWNKIDGGMGQRDNWAQIKRGYMTIVAAIERRWNFPRSSMTPLGAATLLQGDNESPPEVARTQPIEGVEIHRAS